MNKVSLKEISVQISSGLTPLRSNTAFWNTRDIPWVKTEQLGVKNIYDSNEKISILALEQTGLKLNPINTLSLAMYGEGKTRGSVSILKREMTTNQACCNIVIDKNKAHYEYVYYFLKTQYNQLRNLSSGVRKNLNSNDIKNFEIRLPKNLIQQTKIAKVLSDLDAKIELNNKINAKLEATAKLIYDYWFVQFDFPDANGKPYKSSGGKMVYNEELKRDIPVGWEVKELGEVANLKAGGDKPKVFSKYKTADCSIPIYSNGIINDGLYGFTNKPNIIQKSITISARGTIGYCVLRNEPFVPIIRLITITPLVEGCAKYLFEYIKFIVFKKSGSVQQQLTVPQVSYFNIIYPPQEVLNKFELVTSKYLSQIELLKKENQKLEELRDWLLPMLMNGQVCVG